MFLTLTMLLAVLVLIDRAMHGDPNTRAQWSSDSWGRVISTLVAIVLAWWPVAAALEMAVQCRFIKEAGIAAGYILYLGLPSWLLALLIAGTMRWTRSNVLGNWVVLVVCLLPAPLIVLRVHLFVAELLYP
jgi:hypothetical protein